MWDDVQRKTKPPEKPYDYQRARPLNQEKSQRSLAEVYEEDYVRQTLVGVAVGVVLRVQCCTCAVVCAGS